MPIRISLRYVVLPLTLAFLALGASYATYRISQHLGMADLQATGRHRLELDAASLEREIGKYAYFPATLGLERDVIDLLHSPRDARLVGKVNQYLERLNARAGTLSIYVMDHRGLVLAASNFRRSDSVIGEDLAFRPYFRDAESTGNGRFFGIGTTHGEPGYYLSSALQDGERLLGVAVVKVSLEQLEKSWATVEAPVFVADENGVLILSSVPEWKFALLRPVDESTRSAFDRSQQYNRRALQPLGVREVQRLGDGMRVVHVPRSEAASASVYPISGQFLAQSQPLQGTPWSLTVFSHIEQIGEMSRVRAAMAGVSALLLGMLGILFNDRRRHLRERLAAREALQKAYDELERKVEERTADLSKANQQLQDEVLVRARAERTLREAQDELIQAGKLAVIGQLSAGIAHELNQPLAALRTLSGNTVRFLERGDGATARANLERIGQLVDRMGQITGHLKVFAHKSSGAPRPVDVREVVTHAIGILGQRLRVSGTRVVLDFPEEALYAHCDANRLEQVMVNLIGNALDAMAHLEQPRVELHGTHQAGKVRLEVRDFGRGLSAEAQARLFEPFFTTKEAGVGLGLGLAISAGIISDFGGTLGGSNHPDGGALFTLELPEARAAGEEK